jgi:disease resistance protein RPM1
VTDLVGISEAKEEVITRLALGDDDHKKRIVSIAGFGGLGKTTLAKAVHDEIGGQFDCRAFVSVSRNLDAKKFFKDMLYELDKDKFKEIHSTMLEDKHLIDEVIEFIRNKRYVLYLIRACHHLITWFFNFFVAGGVVQYYYVETCIYVTETLKISN